MATREYTTFFLDDQLFAIDILCVREINRMLEVTPVQRAPYYIRGLSNLRGQVITIFDLSDKLNRGPLTPGDDTYNLVLKTNEELAHIAARESRDDLVTVHKDTVSLLVGPIGDVISVDEEAMVPTPANSSTIDGQYLAGVLRHNDELINVINVSRVLMMNDSPSPH
ncbi:MAG: chemotaxis protein CheW [Vampirovibrionales bacterium]